MQQYKFGRSQEKRGAHVYDCKAVIAGNVIELYEYDRQQVQLKPDPDRVNRGRSVEAKSEYERMLYREASLRVARKNVRRLVNANAWQDGFMPVFLTLTFAEDVRDQSEANREFRCFIKRMNHRYNLKLKYVCVIEFQDKNRGGVIHYHIVLFNMPYIDVNEIAREVWRNGFIKLNGIDNVNNLGSYVTKYMCKSFINDEGYIDDRLLGKKSYFSSRGLKTARVVYGDEDHIVKEIGGPVHLVYQSTYLNEYEGYVRYSMVVREGQKGGEVQRKEEVERAAVSFAIGRVQEAGFEVAGAWFHPGVICTDTG